MPINQPGSQGSACISENSPSNDDYRLKKIDRVDLYECVHVDDDDEERGEREKSVHIDVRGW